MAILILAGSVGCASASSTLPNTDTRAPNYQMITQKEIDSYGAGGTALDMINKLRPNFLRSRGQTSIHGGTSPVQGALPKASGSMNNPTVDPSAGPRGEFYPNVFLDGVNYGDVSSLRNLQANQLGEIRLYQPSEAERKFGPGNSAGVIAITTRK